MDRRRPLLPLALLPALLALACNAGGPTTGSPGASGSAGGPVASPAPQWEPRTPWEAAIGDIEPDGHYSLDAALRLFSTAYGPLPGVDGDFGRQGVVDRTVALDAIQEHWDDLTAEQRSKVEELRTPSADALVITIPPVAVSGDLALVAVSDSVQAAVKAEGQLARAQIAGHLGNDFEGDLTVTVQPRPSDTPIIEGQYPSAETSATYVGGRFSSCQIMVYEEATIDPGVVLTNTLAHEVFHCFQRAGFQTNEARLASPTWVKEGQAAWVGQVIGGPSPKYDRFWDKYLLSPTTSVTERTYDALGFYAHLDEVGQSPWEIFHAMWDAGGNSLAIFEAAGANTEEFVDAWAAGVLRDGFPGNAWNATGPGITASAYTPWIYPVAPGADYALGQAQFTNDIDQFELAVDMVQIEIDGHARLRDGKTDLPLHGTVLFCVEGHDCLKKCPNGGDPPLTQGTVAPRISIAQSGGGQGLLGHLRGISLEGNLCSPPPSPEPTDGDFCRLYRAYVDWAEALPEDTDVTKELATEVADQFKPMYPVAPDELKDDVVLVFSIYATFARLKEPFDVPGAGILGGPEAMARLPGALMAMHAYCGIPWPAS